MIRRAIPTMTEAELSPLLAGGSTDRVALVGAKSTTRALAETLAALANGHGGTLVMGVTGKSVIQKEADADAMREALASATLLTDPPLVLPTPMVVTTEQGTALVQQIPAGLPHIYSLQGLFLTRTGGQNRPLTTPELRRLLMERGDMGFEAHVVEGTTLDDLDAARVIRYLESAAFAPLENGRDDVTQALLARGCVRITSALDGTPVVTPTVAGILLFGRHPQQHLRSAEIICVRYAGDEMGDEFVRQDLGGTLPDQIRQAEAFVLSNMRRDMRITGMVREDIAEYPLPVVREAIVNAVAHRDYSVRGEGIRLLMFSDRLEVYSPGRLPGHVTLDNIKDERYSRNETLVAVLSDIGFIERLGYGIDRMIATMEEHGLPAPIFEETAAGFRVILESAAVMAEEMQEIAQPVWRNYQLNERQEMALAYLQSHGRITNSEYQALVPDVSAETIRRDLADLVEKNLLLRIGEKRATYYILK